MISHYRRRGDVVRALEIQAEGLGAIRTQVAAAGGLAAQLRDIEEVSAYHGTITRC
jgi:hypothetical protein